MPTFLYCTPVKSGQVYPPVNTTINTDVTNWHNLPKGTQTRNCIDNGVLPGTEGRVVAVENFLYGLIVQKGSSSLSTLLKINGQNAQEGGSDVYISQSKSYTLDPNTPIYGYSITPDYINLWTDQSYIDTSQDVLYGRRGLYFVPSKNNDWDVLSKNGVMSRCFLLGYDSNCFMIVKDTRQNGSYKLTLDFAGNASLEDNTFPLKGRLKAEAISTANLENIVAQLSDAVKELEQSVASIQNEVDSLIPDLTKLVNAETNKFYVSR